MYYIQNPTSSLKNALEELARKYGKEFNGDVDAFMEASKYASTNGGADNYLKQVFDIANGGGQPPIPTPVIDVDDITGVSEDGVTNATTSIVITDGDGWDVAVTTDGTIVTAASINDSTLIYTVAMNSSTERSGSITITMSMSGQQDVVKTISVTQLGAYTRLEWIKFTRGGYVNTGQIFEQGDRIRFRFELSYEQDSVSLIFGAFTKTSTIHKNRLTFNKGFTNNSSVTCSTQGSGGADFFMGKFNSDEIVTIDFDFSKTSIDGYLINGSSSSIYNFNVSNIPSYNTEYSIYLNSYNINNKNAYEQLSIPSCNMTIYEYTVIDVHGNTKCNIVPVLVNGSPKFKDTINDNYIEISIISGFTPTITYA